MGEQRGGAQRIVQCGDLLPPASAGQREPALVEPAMAPETPAMHGLYRAERLRPNLSLHCTDVRDLHDLTVREVQHEGLRLAVVLDGEVDVSFGPRRLDLGVGQAGRRRQPQAAFVTLREPELFVRRAWRGKHERKVSIAFSREWLTETCADDAAGLAALHSHFDRHLAVERWTPTPRAIALAEQLIHPPDEPLVLRKLYQESRAIELVAEALRHLLDRAPVPPALQPRERRRAADVRDLLDSGAADGMSLEDIARHAGINASTLQKQFRALCGTSIFDYLRRIRLLRARQALERENLTIVAAAAIAGYTSPANFATAYRRLFGLTPRQSRTTY